MHKNHHDHAHGEKCCGKHSDHAHKAPEAGAAGCGCANSADATQDAGAEEKVKNVNFKAAADAYAEAGKQGAKVDATVQDQPEAKAASNEPDYKAIALKTTAEFENFRKRVAKEKMQWKREALADFLKEFLPAFDDLSRALTESEKNQSFQSLHDGTKLVRANLWKVMEKAGVKEIIAHEQAFDPRFHEALTMLPIPGKEAGMVVEVYQPGYLMEDQVLRPSKVVVSAEPPQA